VAFEKLKWGRSPAEPDDLLEKATRPMEKSTPRCGVREAEVGQIAGGAGRSARKGNARYGVGAKAPARFDQ
jgi:hypothetical protein